ncbi:MAG TPA: PAS domain S-box protein [Spirochaetota bacterium]|nr:PAS domain S-box protein [Spirochaetota bacterium]HNT12752.1 PAS domain S-box protein [Spirochaetota bacterium]
MRSRELPKTILLVQIGGSSSSEEYQQLTARGYDVYLAHSPEDALARYHGKPDEVVVVDIAPSSGEAAAVFAAQLLSFRPCSLVFIVPPSDLRQIEYLRDVPHCGNLVKGVDVVVLDETIILSFGNFKTREHSGRLLELNPAVIYSACVVPEERSVMPATFVSGNIETLLGYTPEEVLHDAAFWFECVHPKDRARVLSGVADLFEKGSLSHEYRFRHKNGAYRWLHDNMRLTYDRDGEPIELIGAWFDITERRDIEDKLAHSENMYRFIAENIADLIFTIDFESMKTTYVSPSVERILGYTVEDRMLMPFEAMVTPASFRLGMEAYTREIGPIAPAGKQLNRVFMMDLECYHRDGSVRVLETLFSSIRDAEGRLTGVIGLSRDNTERRELEKKMRLNEALFRALIENSSDVVIVLDDGSRIKYVSPSVKSVFGYEVSERIGVNPFDNIHPEDRDRVMQEMANALRNGVKKLTLEYRFRHRNGSWLTVESIGSDLRDDPTVSGIVINTRDITERKMSEEKVRRLLNDREVLLKEVHHRIKNNMAMIASLFKLGLKDVNDPSSVAVLEDMRGRILTMMKIYDKLYHTDDYTGLHVRAYIEELAREITSAYISGNSICVETDIEDIRIGTKTMYSLGIIINELVSNAIKYAFHDGQVGTVAISLKSIDGSRCELIMSDNGIGYDQVTSSHHAGFGLSLVDMMIKQCNGTLSVVSDHGTRYTITLQV